MRSTKVNIAILFAAWAALTPVAAASLSATAVTVTPAHPEPGDVAGLAWEKTRAGMDSATAASEAAVDPVYLVKVYVKLPPPGAEAYGLWIGDEEIREYGGFKHGIFFKVYDPEKLAKWAGQPLRMAEGGRAPEPLGQDFPRLQARQENRAGSPGVPRSKVKDLLAD